MFLMPSETLKLTSKHKRLLRKTKISELESSSILHDFDALLKLVKEKNILLTPKYQLSLKHLAEINGLFANPIELGLKRPQQKAYPHIQGLYLLLRASGLTIVDESGKKPVLVLNEKTYQEWLTLNPTERYCTLLETWLLRGNIEIIGERGNSWGLPDHLRDWQWFYERTPEGGFSVQGNQSDMDTLKYTPGMYNLGLLELFGFVTIKRGAVIEGKGWQIDLIEHTLLGQAFLALFYTVVNKNMKKMSGWKDLVKEKFGVWQALLRPFFPEWKKNLSVIKPEFREGTYIFKVTLGKIWRRIEIGAAQVFDDFSTIIRHSVNFDDDHLYKFSYRNHLGISQEINHPYMNESPTTLEMKIGDIPLKVGQSMFYLYDFGDSWGFDIILEKIEEGRSDKGANILESHGEAPEQYPNWDNEYE